MEIDRSPCLPFKAGIEKPLGISQRSSLGEGEFHISLEGAGYADEPVGFPNGMGPLPCFREVWAGAEDDLPESRESRAAPVAKRRTTRPRRRQSQ